ncbi:hypothetical protein K491DRAFT_613676, partial [Lophiostoma macrostomum CBS 122681]
RENNSLARVHNSSLRANNQALMRLHEYTTNTPISGFPTTSAHLDDLDQAKVDNILRTLERSLSGDLIEKKALLRHCVGLPE